MHCLGVVLQKLVVIPQFVAFPLFPWPPGQPGVMTSPKNAVLFRHNRSFSPFCRRLVEIKGPVQSQTYNTVLFFLLFWALLHFKCRPSPQPSRCPPSQRRSSQLEKMFSFVFLRKFHEIFRKIRKNLAKHEIEIFAKFIGNFANAKHDKS